jgi:membrane-associated phospholipid phosphatase
MNTEVSAQTEITEYFLNSMCGEIPAFIISLFFIGRSAYFFLLIICFFLVIPHSSFSEPTRSPYHLALIRESVFATAGLSLSLAGDRVASRVESPDPLTLNRDHVPFFDRAALDMLSDTAGKWSDRTRDVCLALPLLAAASTLHDRSHESGGEMVTVLAMYIESNFLIYALTSLAKGTFHRSRPYAYNTELTVDVRREQNASLSFWSGHAASAFNGTVFACTVFQSYHPDSPLVKPVWALGLTAAMTTGFLRIRAGQHFPSDVLAGAAVGSFTGWLVPRLHRNESGRVAVIPMASGIPALVVSWEY